MDRYQHSNTKSRRRRLKRRSSLGTYSEDEVEMEADGFLEMGMDIQCTPVMNVNEPPPPITPAEGWSGPQRHVPRPTQKTRRGHQCPSYPSLCATSGAGAPGSCVGACERGP